MSKDGKGRGDNNLLQMTAELLPTFTGRDNTYPVARWIEDVESNSEIFGWSELQRLLVARKSLKGTAELWLRTERPFKSWDELKAAMLKEFPDTVDVKAIHELMSARKKRQDEACIDYMLAMKELGKRGKMADYVAIKYVVDGIQDVETNKIMLYGVTSYGELKEKLKIYETVSSKLQKVTPVQRNSVNASSMQSSRRRIRCYGCGELGHTSSECPHKNKGMKCFKCNEFGHVGAVCTNFDNQRQTSGDFGQRRGHQQNKQTMFGKSADFTRQDYQRTEDKMKKERKTNKFTQDESAHFVNDYDDIERMEKIVYKDKMSVSKDKKPVVVLKINNVSCKALIDSGSDVNIISVDVYNAIGKPQLQSDSLGITGIGMSTVRSLGKCKVRVCVDDYYYDEVTFHVLSRDFIPYEVIIGQELLNEVTVVLQGSSVRFVSHEWERLGCFASEVCSCESVVGHMKNSTLKDEVIQCVQKYQPNQTKETPLQLKIVLKDEVPVTQRPRRLSLAEQRTVEEQVDEWLHNGIIQVSYSEYSSPLVLVKKKDGTTRVCIDYRLLNKKMIKDEFPMPLIEDLIDKVKDAKVFSVLDLKNGFFHLKISEESIPYTAFVTHHGQYEFLRAPFGLSVSPKYFMRFITIVFKDLIKENIMMIFIDDIIIPARSEKEAVSRLKRVLEVAVEYGLEINWKKAKLICHEIEYLGHLIKDGEVRPSPEKVDAVARYPEPCNTKQIQSFIGLTSYFRKYIKEYARVAKPLTDMMKKDVEFVFGQQQRDAFNTLKKKLMSDPVLKIYDPALPTEVHTDASSQAIAAILMQKHPEGGIHPVRYMSRRTNEAEMKYSSYELEALAIVEGVKKFRHYLFGIHFKIVTDCQAFELTLRKKDLTPKVARWVLLLDEYDYEVEHRAGARMQHTDALSRMPYVAAVVSLHEEMRLAQERDEELNAIRQLIEKEGQYLDYCLNNRVLFKGDQQQIVVPKMMEKEIIKRVHNKGHFASRKMKEAISKDYYIKNVEKKIEEIVSSCIPCLLATRKDGKQEGYLNPIQKEGTPLHTLHLDHVGPLTDTRKCYNHILTMVDGFSKFVWLFPTKSTTTAEVLSKLEIHQQTFGNPIRFITDRGTAFTSGAFQKYCEDEQIQHVPVTTGVPRGNGQVEIMHRTIISVLTKMCIADPSLWYRHVAGVQKALNSTYQRSIDTSPFELMLGTKMRTRDDMEICELLQQEHRDGYVQSREKLRQSAKVQIMKVQEENKKTFDKKRKQSSKYKEGDWVAIKRTQFGPGLKLKPKYLGPYCVVKVKRNDRYDVEKVDGSAEGPIKTSSSADLMKRWPELDEGH